MKMKKLYILIGLVAMCLFLSGFTSADDKAGEEINWQVISSGGTSGTSTNYQLSGTAGQTAVGSGNSTNYGMSHGYWQDFGEPSACDCDPGEANGDIVINIFDITYLISYLYLSGPAPVPYELCNGDPNKDCTCNIFDITYLISFLYLDGLPPCTCEEWTDECGALRK